MGVGGWGRVGRISRKEDRPDLNQEPFLGQLMMTGRVGPRK